MFFSLKCGLCCLSCHWAISHSVSLLGRGLGSADSGLKMLAGPQQGHLVLGAAGEGSWGSLTRGSLRRQLPESLPASLLSTPMTSLWASSGFSEMADLSPRQTHRGWSVWPLLLTTRDFMLPVLWDVCSTHILNNDMLWFLAQCCLLYIDCVLQPSRYLIVLTIDEETEAERDHVTSSGPPAW